MRRRRDTPALVIVATVVLLELIILSMPVSAGVRRLGLTRFHLTGWPLAAWAAAQPIPSMYNFENRLDVTFSGQATAECLGEFPASVNHHVFSLLLVRRAALERCGLPATAHYRSTYRGTTVDTWYRVSHGPGLHGLRIELLRQR